MLRREVDREANVPVAQSVVAVAIHLTSNRTAHALYDSREILAIFPRLMVRPGLA